MYRVLVLPLLVLPSSALDVAQTTGSEGLNSTQAKRKRQLTQNRTSSSSRSHYEHFAKATVDDHDCRMESYENSHKWHSHSRYRYGYGCHKHKCLPDECEQMCDEQSDCEGFVDTFYNYDYYVPTCIFKTSTHTRHKHSNDFFKRPASPPPPPPPPQPRPTTTLPPRPSPTPSGPTPGPSPTPSGPSPSPSGFYGAISSRGSGTCLHLPNGDTTDGNLLQAQECDGCANQKWAWSNGIINWDGGETWVHCMDLPNDDTNNGNKIQIYQCNGSPQQQWGYEESTGSIMLASSSDKCLSLDDGSVQISDCVDSEKWDLGSGRTQLV